MSTINPNDSLCAMCASPGTQACSGCHSIRYCSKGCQKMDWVLHKLVCKSFAYYSDTSRPTEKNGLYKRAIYFSANEPAPRWIWLRFTSSPEGDRVELDPASLPFVEDLIPVHPVQDNKLLERDLSVFIGLSGLRDSLPWQLNGDNDAKNHSLLKVDRELSDWAHGSMVAAAFDPIVAMSDKAQEDIPWQELVFDMMPIHFRHLVDSLRVRFDFVKYKNHKLFTKDSSTAMVKALRLHCIGDQLLFRCDAEIVDVGKAIFDAETELAFEIADRTGMPLVVRRLPHALSWRGRTHLHNKTAYGQNAPATRLQMQKQWEMIKGIDDEAEIIQAQDRASDVKGEIGSVVVVRKDRQPLPPDIIEALFHYATEKICQAQQLAHEQKLWKADVLDDVSKDDWEDYLNRYSLRKGTEAGFMAGLMSFFGAGIPGFLGSTPGSNS